MNKKYQKLLRFREKKKEELFGGTFCNNKEITMEYDTPRIIKPEFMKSDHDIKYTELETRNEYKSSDITLQEKDLNQYLYEIGKDKKANCDTNKMSFVNKKPPLITKPSYNNTPKQKEDVLAMSKYATPPSSKDLNHYLNKLDILKSTNSLVNYQIDSQQNSPYLCKDAKLNLEAKENVFFPNADTKPKFDIRNNQNLKKQFNEFSLNLLGKDSSKSMKVFQNTNTSTNVNASKMDLEAYSRIRKNKRSLFMTNRDRGLEIGYVIHMIMSKK